jgi:CubicO group peptidase (beta-lactamase class C family)
VRQRVFKPVGMKRATFLSSDVTADNDTAFGIGTDQVYAPGAYDDSIERPAVSPGHRRTISRSS